jgi:acetyltransferase-like isoleucine patch superfamily enzyme
MTTTSNESGSAVSRWVLQRAQRLNGTANLEARSLRELAGGIWGRFLQWIAMTFLPLPSAWRVGLQRARGVKIGREVFIGPGCWIDNVRPDLLEIGDHVSLAGRVTILTHSAPTAPLREVLGPESHVMKPVVIERGAWITVNCTILPGVTIGENSIVAAGSVVHKNIPPNVVAAGLPARVISRHKERQSGTTTADGASATPEH